MKKKALVLFVAILSLLIYSMISVSAGTISTLDATSKGDKISVAGETGDGVLAIAVLVYSGDDLIHMETGSASNGKYDCELGKSFEPGEYTVKVADYDGGEYVIKTVTVTEEPAPKDLETVADTDDPNNALLWGGLVVVSLAALTGTVVYVRKQKA